MNDDFRPFNNSLLRQSLIARWRQLVANPSYGNPQCAASIPATDLPLVRSPINHSSHLIQIKSFHSACSISRQPKYESATARVLSLNERWAVQELSCRLIGQPSKILRRLAVRAKGAARILQKAQHGHEARDRMSAFHCRQEGRGPRGAACVLCYVSRWLECF